MNLIVPSVSQSYRNQSTITRLYQPLKIEQIAMSHPFAKIVNINFCEIQNLSGIQKFTELKELSIKHNNITQFKQILKIANKGKIVKLDFRGNDIEHNIEARYFELKKYFPNLVELNGHCYNQIPAIKQINVKKLSKKVAKLQKELQNRTKNLKTSNKYYQLQNQNHWVNTQNLQPNIYAKQTKRYSKKLQIKTKNKEESQGDDHQSSYDYTQKKARNCEHNTDPQKSNLSYVYNPLQEISLGGISNIPMTKSLTSSNLPKKKGLEILTVNESSHEILPLSQPTATFAQQRLKENISPQAFIFKDNKRKQKYHQTIASIEEAPQNITYKDKCNEESYFDSQISSEEDNLVSDPLKINRAVVKVVVKQYYIKNVLKTYFNALRQISRLNSLPVKMSFS